MIENDSSKCRICFLDGKTGASLYNNENSTSYGAMIKDFTGFDLTQNDNLSSLICDSCISELTIVIEFFTKVKTSYDRFKYFNNFDDSWEKNDSYSINEDDTLPISFISTGVFTSIKDEQESKMIGDIKQESVDDRDLSFDNLIPSESDGVFCLNADEEDSPKADIFNSENIVSTFEDTITNRRLQKTPLIIEPHIENHSRLREILVSKTDGLHIKQPIFAVVTLKEDGLKKDKLKCSASIVLKRKHTGERPYHCTCCKKQYIQLSSFNTHMRTLHPEEWIKMPASQEKEVKEISFTDIIKYKRNDEECVVCEYCDKSFQTKGELITHIRIHTNEKPFVCSYCPMTFRLPTSFKNHVRARHTMKQPNWRQVCGNSFSAAWKLRSHLISQDTEKTFVCEYCGKSYKQKGDLLAHIRIHTNEKPFVCSYCPMTFRLPKSFKNHVRARHTMKQSNWWQVCENSFSAAWKLRSHLISHDTEKKYVCEYCGKSYKKKYNLLIHIRIHTNEKPFVCSYCPMTFRLSTSFKNHVRARHTTERPFCCYVCGKSFAAGRYLRRHLTSHTTDKNFQCNICDAFLKTKRLLNLHIRCVHSPKKKICNICGTAFSLTYNLNQHIKRRHSGQQKLQSTSIGLTDASNSTGNIVVQCKVCKKPFSNLEKHMKQHTDEQPFGCDFCNKRFFQRKNLLQHIKKHQN